VEEIFLILVGIAWALGTPLIAIIALVRTSGLRAQNDRLASDLASLRRELAAAGRQSVPPALGAASPEATPLEATPVEVAVPPPPAPPFVPEPDAIVDSARSYRHPCRLHQHRLQVRQSNR